MKCVSLLVCAGRLPHWAVHSAQHHHAGEAADPEQHLWDRHPVSRLVFSLYVLTLLCVLILHNAERQVTKWSNDKIKGVIFFSHLKNQRHPANIPTYAHDYWQPLKSFPRSFLVPVTFLSCLYSGAPSCVTAQLLHANPKGRRSVLFITTVTQQRPTLLTCWVSLIIRLGSTGRPEGAASHNTYRHTIYTPSTHLLHIHPLKSCHSWEPTSKTTVSYWSQCATLQGISGVVEYRKYIGGFHRFQ